MYYGIVCQKKCSQDMFFLREDMVTECVMSVKDGGISFFPRVSISYNVYNVVFGIFITEA